MKNANDVAEGAAVICQIGEVEDAPFIPRQLDDKVRKAAGAAGVKEDQGGAACHEPSACIVTFFDPCDGTAQAAKDGGEAYQFIFL